MTDVHACHCGTPAPNANICNGCADGTRDRLLLIADRWTELTHALQWRETPHAGHTPPRPRLMDPNDGAGNATGITLNGQAIRAMDRAADVIRYTAMVLRGAYNDTGKPLNPPPTDGSMDDIPKLARWIGMWHLEYLARRLPDEGIMEAIVADVTDAERRVYRALHPAGTHWAPVNLDCDDHDTSDLGERIPCPGRMWAKVGTDLMPDLVCDHSPEHTIEPGTWERQGWRRRLRQPLNPNGMAKLAQRLTR